MVSYKKGNVGDMVERKSRYLWNYVIVIGSILSLQIVRVISLLVSHKLQRIRYLHRGAAASTARAKSSSEASLKAWISWSGILSRKKI